MTQEQLMAMVRELIATQVDVIMAERVVDQLGNTDALALDIMLEGRTVARQQLAQKVGAFLRVVRALAEERVVEIVEREGRL